MEKSFKSYLVIPLVLTLFLAKNDVQAEEIGSVTQNGSVAVTESSEKVVASLQTEASTTEAKSNSLTSQLVAVTDTGKVATTTEQPISEVSVATSRKQTEATAVTKVAENQLKQQQKAVVTEPKLAEARVAETPAQNAITVNQTAENMEVSYSGEIPKDSEVRVAVWSQAMGQDDLKWYTMNNAHTTVPYNNHWEYGLYHLHAYLRQKATGKMTFVKSEEVTLAQPKLETNVKATSQTSFEVTVSNVPKYFKKLYVPIWSAANGQDDIKWYQAQKQNNGTYKLSVDTNNHKSSTGLYHIHYYEEKPNGKKVYVGQATYTQPVPKAPSLTVKALNDRQFEVTIGNVPAKYTRVLLPTWTEKNGQDDIKWYQAQKQANGNYKVTVSLDQHQFETNKYHLHLYGESSGKKTFLASTTYDQPKSKVESSVKGIADDKFTITVKNVPSYINQVRIPTWTDKGGQDDIKWYVANKQKDGSYQLTVDTKEHKYESGRYHLHVYGNAGSVANIFLNAVTHDVAAPKKVPISSKPETTVKALTATSFKVTVKNVPNTIGTVMLPTWSAKSDQDDIKWYQAKKETDGSYSLTVDIKDHKNDTGIYHIHSYGRTKDGKLTFLDGDTIDIKALPKPTAKLEIKNVNNQIGTFDVIVSNLKSANGIKQVHLPTWSDANGQDDIMWYTASKQSNGTYKLTVRASDHKYSSGKYHVHLYVTDEKGKQDFVSESQVNLEVKNIQKGSASKGNYKAVNKVIYLDAGHGGSDPGAAYYGQQEKTLNLDMQNRLKTKLEKLGYQVVLTRSDDRFVDLLPRSEKANQSNADLFISIHFNAATSPSASGVETYYYQYYSDYPSRINKTYHNDKERLRLSASLASTIQNSVVGTSGAKNGGVKRNTFAVLRETTAPAVLLELGYLSNSAENRKIATVDYREKLANGIVQGITDYYKTNF